MVKGHMNVTYVTSGLLDIAVLSYTCLYILVKLHMSAMCVTGDLLKEPHLRGTSLYMNVAKSRHTCLHI